MNFGLHAYFFEKLTLYSYPEKKNFEIMLKITPQIKLLFVIKYAYRS